MTMDVTRRYTREYLAKRLPVPAGYTPPVGMGGTRHRRGSVTDQQQELHDFLVEHHGGHSAYFAPDGSIHIVRPGKDWHQGSSASIITGEQGDAILTVYSSNWGEIGPRPGEASRSWRLVDEQLVEAHLDPLDGVTITATAPPGASGMPAAWGLDEEADEGDPPPPLSIPTITFEAVPDPFVVPAITWHATALLARPTHGEIAGAEKSLKSYVSLAITVGLCTGKAVLDRFEVPERQRVVMLVGEGGKMPWLRRLAAVCAAYGIEPGELNGWLRFTMQTASVASVRFAEGLRHELETFGPSLVLLDPWYAFAAGQADSRQVTEVGASLEMYGTVCREHGASAFAVHHFNRNSDAPGLRQITGAGHAEWVDSWLMLKHRLPAQPASGLYRLGLDVGSRQWGGENYDLDFTVAPLTGAVSWSIEVATDEPADEPDPLSVIKLAILRAGRQAKKALTRQAWCARIKHRKTDTYVAFDELLADGLIVAVATVQAANNKTVSTYEVAP